MGMRVAIPLLLFELLLAPGLAAQKVIFSVPDETARNVILAQAEACRIAEAASGAELEGLDLALKRTIEELDQHVRALSADSLTALAAEAALPKLEAELKALETEIGPLHVRRNEINSAQKPYEDEIAATIRGDNPARKSLDEVNAEIKALEEDIGRLETALAEYLKKNPNPGWLEGRHEELGAAITKKRGLLRALEDKRLTILRAILRVRIDPDFGRLLREEEALDRRIQSLEERIAPLREARDAAKKTLADTDLQGVKKLWELHELNGFVDQYLSQARDCVQKRRTALASGAQPPPAGPTAPATPAAPAGFQSVYLTGRWDANCSGDLPADAARSDGGNMNFYFGDTSNNGTEISLKVDFITSGKVIGIDFGATGRVLNDGTIADGRGGASFYSLVWDGRLAPDMARSDQTLLVPDKWLASGSVTVTDLFRAGGGTCTGTWTAATP